MNATVLRLIIAILKGELGRRELVIDQRFDVALSRQFDLCVEAIGALEGLLKEMK